MKHAEYTRQAEFCRSQADNTESEMMKRIWKRLAAYWLSLSPKGPTITHGVEMCMNEPSDGEN